MRLLPLIGAVLGAMAGLAYQDEIWWCFQTRCYWQYVEWMR